MKKFKEFLWFLVPFLSVGVITILVIILRVSLSYLVGTGTMQFMSSVNYIRLLLKDSFFQKMLFNMYFVGTSCSVIIIGLFTIICKIASRKTAISQKFYRIGSVVIGTVTTIILQTVIGIITTFWSLADAIQVFLQFFNLTPSITVWHLLGIFNFFFAIQSAIIAAFLFWLAESIVGFIKSKKAKLQVIE